MNTLLFCAGELGGVTTWFDGAGPGGQKGICLFGIGVEDLGVLRVSEDGSEGGVEERSRRAECCCSTTVAIMF